MVTERVHNLAYTISDQQRFKEQRLHFELNSAKEHVRKDVLSLHRRFFVYQM
jgi:hypothetical protein